MDLWETVGVDYTDARSDSSFWALPLGTDNPADLERIHTWLKGELSYLQYMNRDRYRNMNRNIALMRGIQYRDQDSRLSEREKPADRRQLVEKIVQNHLYELSTSRISKLTKYKPAVAVLPRSDDYGEALGATTVKAWLDHVWYEERFDGGILPKVARWAQPMGEAFLFVDWDPYKGDISNQWKEAEAAAKDHHEPLEAGSVTLVDAEGAPQLDARGRPIVIKSPIRNGDVQYRVRMTRDVFAHWTPEADWDLVNYVFERSVMRVDEARLRWPKGAKFIRADKDVKIYDFERFEHRNERHSVEIWTFWHKRTQNLEDGAKIVFTKDGVISAQKFPFSHRRLPCVRYADIEMPGELHGRSFFDLVRGATGAHNNLTNMILRNMVMAGHPKWMLPAGTAKIEELGNSMTVVQFKGPRPPQLVSANTTGAEMFNFRNMLKEEFQKMAGVGLTAQGEPPKGITAAVALQWLSELENERWNEPVLKWNEFILQVAELTREVARDRYDRDDKRSIRMLGQSNAWLTKAFNVALLEKQYEFRIQSTSALPESKAARTEYLLFLNERFPNHVPDDTVMNLLDLSQSSKFVTIGTVSVRAAEAENEQMRDPKNAGMVAAPTEEEDHIAHWRSHVKEMREWTFKNRAPVPIKQAFTAHVRAHEFMMSQRAKQNPLYLQQLAGLEGFPIFFQPLPSAGVSAPPAPDAGPGGSYATPPAGAPAMGGPAMGAPQSGGGPIDQAQLPQVPPGSEPANPLLGGPGGKAPVGA